MEETIEWLKDRPYYEGQIVHETTVPETAAQTTSVDLVDPVAAALRRHGIDELYEHQADAIEAIRGGDHVVLATPTASGKSLAYTIPALERALDHEGTTLYIAPMQALINDQADTLTTFADSLDTDEVDVVTYTGETPRSDRRAIRTRHPDIVLTTPDMVHGSVLQYGKSETHWKWLFETLETVVVDEIHEFRGIFGSHVSLVFRRLARLADYYESTPQYICCSATIGNPIEHAAAVTGQPADEFSLVADDTSAAGPRHWLFWNPPLKENDRGSNFGHDRHDAPTPVPGQPSPGAGEPIPTDPATDPLTAVQQSGATGGERRSNHPETVRLFCDLVQRGYQTLVFTSARQGAEQYTMWCDERLRKRGEHDIADTITAYHAGLSDDRRGEVEAGLRGESVRGVWSTNALELGIDIGSLDLVLLDGYPGTSMNTFQRAGRAGRGQAPSLVVLVGSPNPLDQYCMANPEHLFEGDPERVAVNPTNSAILTDHVRCAAQELFLGIDDEQYFGDEYPAIVSSLDDAGKLERWVGQTGPRWRSTEGDDAQHQLDIRSIDDREIELFDHQRLESLTTLSFADTLRDAHPGAIYHHQKETYRVTEADFEADRVLLESVDTMGYTRPLTEKRVTVHEVLETSGLPAADEVAVGFADLTVADEVTGYMHYDHPADEDGVERGFEEPLPERTIRTKGLYFTIPSEIEQTIRVASDEEDGFVGSIHALEHALISLFPLEILCARRDVGGLSTDFHPHTGRSTVFVHDAYPGGVGLTRDAFTQLGSMLERTLSMLRACPCADGCPSCVHSPQCGNANRLLNKRLAIRLLVQLVGDRER